MWPLTTIDDDSCCSDDDHHISTTHVSSSQVVDVEPTPTNGNIRLKIIRQPEAQHRARYLSEGSRGAIKDQSGVSHCTIQLKGYSRPTRVEIYASVATAPYAPHSLYRLIPIIGKSGATLPCRESTSVDGIACIEVVLRPENQMTAVLDCMGILKICNPGQQRQRSTKSSLKNEPTTVRLVFRARVPISGTTTTACVQTVSTPILCVQQLGLPEILRISLHSSPCRGGSDLFIVGRNFDPRNTSVIFREYKDDGKLAWSADAIIDRRLLHQCHLVCSVPTYRDLTIKHAAPIEVSITVSCGNKNSHPVPFHYYSSSTMPNDDITSIIGDLSTSSSYSPWTTTITTTPAPSSIYSITTFDDHHLHRHQITDDDDDFNILASMMVPIESSSNHHQHSNGGTFSSTKTIGGGACQDIDDESWVIDDQLLTTITDNEHPVPAKRLRLIDR